MRHLKQVFLIILGVTILSSCSKYKKEDFYGAWADVVESEGDLYFIRGYEFTPDTIYHYQALFNGEEYCGRFDVKGTWDYEEHSKYEYPGVVGVITYDWILSSMSHDFDNGRYDPGHLWQDFIDRCIKDNDDNVINRKNSEIVSGMFVKSVGEEELRLFGHKGDLIFYRNPNPVYLDPMFNE